MDVLRRQPNMPEWLNQVIKELTRPPYFLEHLYTQHQSDKETSTQAFTSTTADSSAQNQGQSPRYYPNHAPHSHRPAAKGKASENANHKDSSEWSSQTDRKSSGRQGLSSPAQRQKQEFVATAMSASSLDKSSVSWQATFRRADIPVSLTKAYAWNIRRCQQVANVLRVETKGGTYALKSTHLSPKRVEFLHGVFAHLQNQGFTRYAPFVLTKQHRNPYAVRKTQTYYASQWVPGTSANFSSLQQIGLVAKTLSQFHELTRGFESEGYSPPMEYGLSAILRRRTEDLRALLVRAEARKPADAFDKLLLKLGVQLRADAESSIRHIEDEHCAQFLAKDAEYPGLCHLDVIPGNFIYSDPQTMYAIDFDLATFAPRVLDLSHLLRRSLQRQNWRSEVAYTCFVQYNDTQTIRSQEYQLLLALLMFPYRAWRLAHTRYRVLEDDLQVQELQEYASQEERRQKFISEYARQISHLA